MRSGGRGSVPMRIRIALVFVILGVLNALIAAGVTSYLEAQRPIDASALRAWISFAVWMWPSSIMMMAADSHNPPMVMVALALAVSAAINGCLYGVVGLLLGAVWEKLALPRTH